MPNVDNRVPVRAVFKGEIKNSSAQMQYFETELEFYQFRSVISDYLVFQTPSTVFCNNRKKTKDLPYLGGVFGYSEEVFSQRNATFEYIQVNQPLALFVMHQKYNNFFLTHKKMKKIRRSLFSDKTLLTQRFDIRRYYLQE
jgi:hypothetical protein